MTPTSPPRLSPLRRGVEQEARQADLEDAEQAEAERREEQRHGNVQPGVVRQVLERRGREEERTEHADRRENPDDRQAIDDRQTGGPALVLPLLDEEVDRDRHHRPDARHHQRTQPSERREEEERNQPRLGLLRDLADHLGARAVQGSVRCEPAGPPRPRVRQRRVRRSASRRAESTGPGCCRSVVADLITRRPRPPSRAPRRPVRRQRHVGQGPLARNRAGLVVADLVTRLAADRLRPRLGPRRHQELDAPGHLILVDTRGRCCGMPAPCGGSAVLRRSIRRRPSGPRCRRGRTS